MSEEVEMIGHADAPMLETDHTPAEQGASIAASITPEGIDMLGANLRNAEDNLAYLRMSEMRQDAIIKEVQDRMGKIELAVEKVRFYLTFALGLVLASMAITMISLLHEVGAI